MRFLWLTLGLVCWPLLAQANGPLRSIVIFGNEKTERATILSIIGVESQTYVNDRLIRDVDDRLVSSGLFKRVSVVKLDNPDGTTDLRITVAEKVLWFIFPVFQAWSDRYSGGLAFGESNLFAPNASTLIALEGGNDLSRIFLAFEARNVFDTNFVVRTWMLGRKDDIPLYAGETKTGSVTLKDAAISVAPGYQWTNDIRTSMNFRYRYVDYGDTTGFVPSGTQGDDVSLQFEFVHDSLRRREAFLKGNRLRAAYEFAEERFGTDFTYHIQEVEFKTAWPLLHHFNYVLDLEGAIGDASLPFHRDFTLGGSSLRGFADRQFRGDTLIRARQDLLVRLLKRKRFSLFGLAFHDLGLLYRDSDGIGRSSLHNGVGGGIRVSLADIIAPVVGVDAAYGIEDRSFRILAALGLVEF